MLVNGPIRVGPFDQILEPLYVGNLLLLLLLLLFCNHDLKISKWQEQTFINPRTLIYFLSTSTSAPTFMGKSNLSRWAVVVGTGWANVDKYQKPHVLVAKLFTIFTRTCSGSYAISWLECRQTNMFDAKTVILYWTSNIVVTKFTVQQFFYVKSMLIH